MSGAGWITTLSQKDRWPGCQQSHRCQRWQYYLQRKCGQHWLWAIGGITRRSFPDNRKFCLQSLTARIRTMPALLPVCCCGLSTSAIVPQNAGQHTTCYSISNEKETETKAQKPNAATIETSQARITTISLLWASPRSAFDRLSKVGERSLRSEGRGK